MGYTKGRARRAAEKLTEKHIAVRPQEFRPKTRAWKQQLSASDYITDMDITNKYGGYVMICYDLLACKIWCILNNKEYGGSAAISNQFIGDLNGESGLCEDLKSSAAPHPFTGKKVMFESQVWVKRPGWRVDPHFWGLQRSSPWFFNNGIDRVRHDGTSVLYEASNGRTYKSPGC